jgi:hypothetical protein
MTRARRHPLLLGGVVLLGIAGCQTVDVPRYYRERLSESFVQQQWLPSLRDGETTREQIEARLGKPSRRYEEGRLAVYRLILEARIVDPANPQPCRLVPVTPSTLDKNVADRQLAAVAGARLLVVTDDNHDELLGKIATTAAEYNVVLVYNSAGVLERHAIHQRHP